jgi:hypothetical protein
MPREFAIVGLALWIGLAGLAWASAAEKTPQQIEQQYDQEKSPRKRAQLARDLMNVRLNQLRSALESGSLLQESTPELRNYLNALDRLASAVREARHANTSKQSEMHLRKQLRDLEDERMDVSVSEREILDRAIKQVSDLREEILYSLLVPEAETAKQ